MCSFILNNEAWKFRVITNHYFVYMHVYTVEYATIIRLTINLLQEAWGTLQCLNCKRCAIII